MGPAAGRGADGFLAGAEGSTEAEIEAAALEGGAGAVTGVALAGAAAGLADACGLETGFAGGVGLAAGVLTSRAAFWTEALASGFLGKEGLGAGIFLTGFLGAGFLARSGFFLAGAFFAGADFAFFLGTGFASGFFLAAGLNLCAAGLAFPWAAFFLMLLDLLTV